MSNRRIYLTALAIVMCTLLAVLAIVHFANRQYAQAEADWHMRLNLIADSRSSDVEHWVRQHFTDLSTLARNASLQLYTTELQMQGQSPDELLESSSQYGYLHHLLALASDRGGFTPDISTQDSIPANIQYAGGGGIALLDMHGKVLVATAMMPPLEGRIADFIANAKKGEQALLDAYSLSDGTARMGWLTPVYAIQGGTSPSDQVAMLVGIQEIRQELFDLLRHPGTTESTLSAHLVRRDREQVVYLSPIAGHPVPLSLSLPYAPAQNAASAALANPGSFGILPGHTREPLLFTSRAIAGTPWVLVQQISQQEALAAAAAMRSQLLMLLLFALALVIAAIIAAWRHGTSRKAVALSRQLADTVRELHMREGMLALVTDAYPGSILLLDKEHRIHFANAVAAQKAGISAQDMQGKNLDSVFGPGKAKPYKDADKTALQSGEAVSWIRRSMHDGHAEHIFRTTHIPVGSQGENEAAKRILAIEEDITSVVQESERKIHTRDHLVEALVHMVDQRDPHAARHSAMVARLARAIAEEMSLEPQLVQTAETAGGLLNIGKMAVPGELLTKAGSLDESEKALIHSSLAKSIDMLQHVEFEGPVLETLRQAFEAYDGSGRQHLKGSEILITARIVNAANAFASMISPRSYREALPSEKALAILQKQSDTVFDRKVVIALANYIENRNGETALRAIHA